MTYKNDFIFCVEKVKGNETSLMIYHGKDTVITASRVLSMYIFCNNFLQYATIRHEIRHETSK